MNVPQVFTYFKLIQKCQVLNLKISAAIRLINKIMVEKSKKKNLRRVSSSILEKLKIFKPDDVSRTQCKIEANEMEMEDFCCKYIQTYA